jgi:exopolyphosphatase/guanosine-5'-triphosphate,3'-diphosphate pyrophosphatase
MATDSENTGEERMFAAVDLGSNSFRLHVGHYDGQAIRIVKSAREPIRLAAGIDSSGNLTPAAMQTALDCLTRFKAILAGFELEAVRVVATSTLRIARNAATFLPSAEKALGQPIEIISGEEEGRLIYMGVACSLGALNDRRLVIDIGGGSTELILGVGHDIKYVESFTIGTFKQSMAFFGDGRINLGSFDAAILSARSRFEDAVTLFEPLQWEHAYGSSGTIRAIADAIGKNSDASMSYADLEELKTRLISFGHSDRIVLPGMKPDRATVIVGGLAILMGLMQELGIKAITPIEAGLRMGVLWDLQLRATRRDRRDDSVEQFRQRFHADGARARQVAEMAGALFTQLKPASDALAKYLHWSGLLHEIGVAVSHSGYHKHGAYLMQNADLAGFTTREQRTMSALVLAQKGNLRKISEALSDADFAKAVLALRLAVIFMHSRIAFAAEDIRLRMRNKIELEIKTKWLAEHPTIAFLIDKEREAWADAGIDFTLKKSS